NCDAEETELTQLRPQVARECVFAVDGLRSRRDMIRRKGAHRLAQHVRGFAKRKIQGGFSFGDSPFVAPGAILIGGRRYSYDVAGVRIKRRLRAQKEPGREGPRPGHVNTRRK